MSGDEKFKELLDSTYTWPADFPFKFIVKQNAVADFLKLFPQVMVHQEHPSSHGKYVSVNFVLRMNSAEEVLAIYGTARGFPGIIAL